MPFQGATTAIAPSSRTVSAQVAIIPAAPLTPLDQWFHPEDYPPASMRGAEEGDVSALLTIDAQGLVTGCRITRSSGHPLLDRATCTVAGRRAPGAVGVATRTRDGSMPARRVRHGTEPRGWHLARNRATTAA